MTNNDISNLLPLGSIVKLDSADKKVMIIGVCPQSKNELSEMVINDYIGVLYPEGYISSDFFMVFDRDKVSEVVHIGYEQGDEWKEFLGRVSEIVSK